MQNNTSHHSTLAKGRIAFKDSKGSKCIRPPCAMCEHILPWWQAKMCNTLVHRFVTMSWHMSPQKCPFRGESGPTSNTWFLGTT